MSTGRIPLRSPPGTTGRIQLQGVEPWSYLRDVLAKIAAGWPARRIDELLPDRWAVENPELLRPKS